ncbi:MAG: DUF429 domain-containing protein [Rhodospirillales bacterium]|nr:DUF429 domain-containing protein [Rhodospirillales bacterium]
MPEVLAGVDGCRGGWIAALGSPPSTCKIRFYASIEELLRDKKISIIVVDMPIGLACDGRRRCDRLARECLPPFRTASVFPSPARHVLTFRGYHSYHSANAWSEENLGRELPIQSYSLVPKIREIDRAIGPADQARLFESHPELAFHRLANPELAYRRLARGVSLASKKTPEGQAERQRLLLSAGLQGLESALDCLPRGAMPDDVLDAAMMLVVAARILSGRAERLPSLPERDERGLDMAMWV